MRKVYLISNMYPSEHNVRYGIFVKMFEEAITKDFEIKRLIITKQYSSLSKLTAYFTLYFKIFLLHFRIKKDDIVYVHFPLHVAPILMPFYWLKRHVVLNFHGTDLIFDNPIKKILAYFQKRIISKSNIVVPSNYYKEKIISEFHVDSTKVFVYPSGGIDKRIFYVDKTTNGKSFTLGYVSNFVDAKGWIVFLEALRELSLNKLISNLNVIMVGDGPDKPKIIEYISKNNLLVTLQSNLTHKDLAVLYNKISILVFPTYGESLGLVGLESLACGTPVIASRVGGPMGYIKDGENGYLFNKKDVDGLVSKILHYYQLNDVEKTKMQDNAIQTASLYDKDVVNINLISFLKKI